MIFTQGQVVPAGDTGLFVSEAGKADGHPLVLLHGGLGSRADFEPLARHLAADYRLVAVDSRGHGRSSLGQARISYRQLAQDIATVLNRLGLERAALLGHSDGGIIALRLGVSGLVQPCGIITAGAHWRLPADDPARAIYDGITLAQWQEMFGPQIARYEAENPAPDFVRLFAATRAMWLGDDGDAYPGESIRTLACPLLVLHGEEDFLVSRHHAFALAEQVHGARLLNLPFAGHMMLEERPEKVVPSLRAFMERAFTTQADGAA